MSMSSAMVKQAAKEALFDRFLQSVAVCCIFIFSFFIALLTATLVTLFAGNIGYFISMLAMFILVLCPMFLGVLCFLRRLLWKQADSVLVVFKYFSSFANYKRAIKFVFSMLIRFVLIAVVLFSPSIVVGILSNEQIYSALHISLPVWASNLWTLNSLLAFVSALAFVFVTLKYYLAPFIFVCNDEIDTAEAINMSVVISKRTGADFFGLVFSFAGWILLSLLILPMVFVLPYFLVSYGTHCRFAIQAYNDDVDIFNLNTAPSYQAEDL